MIIGPFTLTCVGADGSAAATYTTQRITGFVDGYHVKYAGDKPATTDVTIATNGSTAPARTLLTLTDKNTDGYFRVRSATHSNLGVASATDIAMDWVDSPLTFTVAQANTDDVITIWLNVMAV